MSETSDGTRAFVFSNKAVVQGVTMPGKRHPSTGDPNLQTYKRRKLRAAIAFDKLPCQHPQCKYPGVPIDYDSKSGPLSYVLDEVIPRAMGGDPADPRNVRPAHHACNAAAGARLSNVIRKAKRINQSSTANRW